MQHSDHDLVLVAGLAAGDLLGSERARAQALVDACSSCAELRADLVAIAVATQALPNRATAPRDFRLDAAQAARLRRGSWLRTILAPFSATRSTVRPLAAGFTSLGLVGLLVATVLPGLFGSAASLAPERDATGGVPAATAAPGQPVDAAGGPTAPIPNGPGINVDGGQTGAPGNGEFGNKDGVAPSAAPGANVDGGRPVDAQRTSGFQPLTALLVGSLALLLIGLALFGLQAAGRRLRR